MPISTLQKTALQQEKLKLSKKRIAIIINSLSQGGAERVLSILLERFYHDSTFKVELILLEDKIAYAIPKEIKVTLLSSLNNAESNIKKTLYIPILAYKLHRYIQQNNPDLIVSFLYRADYVNILASFFHNVPVIVSERVNASSMYNNQSLNAKINKFLIKKLYPKASMVINVSEGTKQDLVENFGIDAAKQIVICNPYNVEKIQKLSQVSIDFDIPREKTLIAVSRFRKTKNMQMLLQAFSRLEEEAWLVLVGDGEDESLLRRLAGELDIESRVIFAGSQDNPYQYMSKAGIYLSASRSEGFPNAMVEAMICGCAVISTDCPSGPREILSPTSDSGNRLTQGIEYAEFGTLVAVDDVSAMREAMSSLLCHDNEREKFAQKAIQRAADFQLEKVYKQYCDAFLSVIEGASL